MRNHSNENEFDLHENEPVGGTHFHMNGFARRLVLKQRQKGTRKWPIVCAQARRQGILLSDSSLLLAMQVEQSWGGGGGGAI